MHKCPTVPTYIVPPAPVLEALTQIVTGRPRCVRRCAGSWGSVSHTADTVPGGGTGHE